MKKLILFFLLFAGTGNVLHAQFDLPDPVESMFNTPKTSKSDVVFTFYLKPQGRIRMILDMNYISQVDGLPDLDSLLQGAIKILSPLQDSLRSDGMVRRVDIVMRNELPKIRILSHPELSNSYTIKDNELMQLKVNQDTVRLITYARSRLLADMIVNGVKTKNYLGAPVVITFITDNVGDLTGIEPGQLKECIAALHPKVDAYTKSKRQNLNAINYRAFFNMKMNGQMVSPKNATFLYSGEARWGISFAPTFGFARGSFTPGMELGLEYKLSNGYYNRTKLRLFTEVQAFFPRDPVSNKVTTEINRFVGIQLIQYSSPVSDKFGLAPNFSLSYLTSTSNTYEKNTFRLGLPALSNTHFTFEPQFVFNDFFDNVTPSIKLTFNLFSISKR